MSNFNFLFQLFVKLFAFDPFLVPGDCDVTNVVKFWIFWYFGFITAFLVSKLVQVSNFNFLFQLFVKLFAFDPFLVRGIVTSLTGSNFEFLIFGLHHWIPRVKISASVKFQLFISIICEVICFWPFFGPGGLWRH